MYPSNTVAVPASYLLDIVDNNDDQPVQLPNPFQVDTVERTEKKKEKRKTKGKEKTMTSRGTRRADGRRSFRQNTVHGVLF